MRRDEQGDKARRAKIRDQLAVQGLTHPDDVAARFLREWPSLTPMGAYRLVEEMSQPVVADRYNTATGRQPFESGWMTRREVSRLELWPHHGDARRPTAGELVILARVFGASSPVRLIDAPNWPLLDPADQAALHQQYSGDTQAAGPGTAAAVSAHPAAHPAAGAWPPAGFWPQARPPAAHRARDTGTDSSAGPPSVERLITMAARESTSFGDHPTNIGPFTMEQFRADATRLARLFPTAPRLELFTELRWQRDQVFDALEGRQPVEQTRQLYFLAAATCGMLAEVTEQLGFRDAAMAHARTGWLCAKEADHHGLMAWILQMQGLISLWTGRAGKAVEYAVQGQEIDAPGTVAVWLPALEARARAALGDGDGTHAALNRAREAREQVSGTDDLDEIGGIFRYSEAKQLVHGGSALVALGDGEAAQPMSQAAIRAYEGGPAEECAHDLVTAAHLDLALARVMGGDLDGATQAATAAFELPPELHSDGHDQRTRELHRSVSTPRYRSSPVAATLRDQAEAFLRTQARGLSVP